MIVCMRYTGTMLYYRLLEPLHFPQLTTLYLFNCVFIFWQFQTLATILPFDTMNLLFEIPQ